MLRRNPVPLFYASGIHHPRKIGEERDGQIPGLFKAVPGSERLEMEEECSEVLRMGCLSDFVFIRKQIREDGIPGSAQLLEGQCGNQIFRDKVWFDVYIS